MIRSRQSLLLALAFPVLVLAGLVLFRTAALRTGHEVTLPISGYDPRDLLSGHYLTYRVDYGLDSLCSGSGLSEPAFVCLETRAVSKTPPADCPLFIQGTCKGSVFEAGIERYYIPEDQAARLEGLVRSKVASIRVSVGTNGRAQVKDLLIDGRSWRDQ